MPHVCVSPGIVTSPVGETVATRGVARTTIRDTSTGVGRVVAAGSGAAVCGAGAGAGGTGSLLPPPELLDPPPEPPESPSDALLGSCRRAALTVRSTKSPLHRPSPGQ